MKVTKEEVLKALGELESDLSKASDHDLDQPEGADLGNSAKEKLSDEAKSAKAKKSMKKDMDADGDHDGDEEKEEKSMKAAPKKKAYEDADHVDEAEEHSEHHKSAKKSFSEDMPEEIQTKIDVSAFLKSLVDHTGECVDELREAVAKSDMAHENRYDQLVETVVDVQKSQAKIGVVLKAICERIGVIENAPATAPKAETVAKSGAVERKFDSALAGEQQEKVFKSLSENPVVAKSQMSDALCDLVRKGEASDLDVIGFESGGYIRPELVGKLKSILN